MPNYKWSRLWTKLPEPLTRQRAFLQSTWTKMHIKSIESGTLPANIGEYRAQQVYKAKFGIPMWIIIGFTGFIFYFIEYVCGLNALATGSRARTSFLIAIMSAPAIIYAWFIRAHERGLKIKRDIADLWSQELNSLINQAVDPDKQLALRLVAIRQLQDYLSGAKWSTNQAANSSAILQAFSSIIDEIEKELLERQSI